MRRTKPTLIYRRTKNLRAVQLLLGHTKLESTVRYLGIEVDDALEIAEHTEVWARPSWTATTRSDGRGPATTGPTSLLSILLYSGRSKSQSPAMCYCNVDRSGAAWDHNCYEQAQNGMLKASV